jgi:uncharacterized secreted protein with C-terminal beta-propeller domain
MRKLTKIGAGGGLAAVALGGLVASGVLTASAVMIVGDPLAPRAVATSGLTRFDSCDQLLRWYRAQGLRSVGAYGWNDGSPVAYPLDANTGMQERAAAPQAAAGTDNAVGSSATGTNTQEAGVDEPDVAKTNGSLLVRVSGRSVLISDVSGAQPRALASYPLPPTMYAAELLLVGHRVVVTSTGSPRFGGPVPMPAEGMDRNAIFPRPSASRVLELDVSDPARPTLVSDQTYSGALVSARQYGDVVRLVTRTAPPLLRFNYPSNQSGVSGSLEKNRALVWATTIDDWLPTVTTGSGTHPLVACDQVLHPRTAAGPGTLAVVGFDVATPDVRSTVAVTAGGDTVYSSTDRLFVATSDVRVGLVRRFGARVMGMPLHPRVTTDLHEFDLAGTAASYVASGSLAGQVRDRWSMDEHGGYLRVALQTGNAYATNDGANRAGANAVVTLRRSGARLVESGRVAGLGAGEEIKSVRWFDDLAVVVTFRQMDPLYTVDLSDPAHPRLTGELRIPGFSGYLHPIGHHRLLGIGVDSGSDGRARGALVQVFDLSDLAHPTQLATHTFGMNTDLAAPEDPRAFTWLPGVDGAGVGWTQVRDWMTSSFRLARIETDSAGNLSVSTHAFPGVQAWDGARVLPLPDGRVVLVAGTTARILAG